MSTSYDTSSSLEALQAVSDLLNTAEYNRFGKAEWYSVEGMAARERIRELAQRYDVARLNTAGTILGQAGCVARAALEKAR